MMKIPRGMKRMPMMIWIQRTLEVAGRLEMVVWPKFCVPPEKYDKELIHGHKHVYGLWVNLYKTHEK